MGAGGEASQGKPAAVAALSINSPEELALRTYSSRTLQPQSVFTGPSCTVHLGKLLAVGGAPPWYL